MKTRMDKLAIESIDGHHAHKKQKVEICNIATTKDPKSKSKTQDRKTTMSMPTIARLEAKPKHKHDQKQILEHITLSSKIKFEVTSHTKDKYRNTE